MLISISLSFPVSPCALLCPLSSLWVPSCPSTSFCLFPALSVLSPLYHCPCLEHSICPCVYPLPPPSLHLSLSLPSPLLFPPSVLSSALCFFLPYHSVSVLTPLSPCLYSRPSRLSLHLSLPQSLYPPPPPHLSLFVPVAILPVPLPVLALLPPSPALSRAANEQRSL